MVDKLPSGYANAFHMDSNAEPQGFVVYVGAIDNFTRIENIEWMTVHPDGTVRLSSDYPAGSIGTGLASSMKVTLYRIAHMVADFVEGKL